MSTTVPPPFDFEELFGVNAGFVEQVYTEYMARPDAVTEEWQRFFERHLPPEHLPERKPEPVAKAEPKVEPGEVPAHFQALKGVASKIAQNMSESLSVPTATSTREIPVRVLEENRKIINEHLVGEVRGKASFTHIIAWAMVRAMQQVPGMLVRYVEKDGKAYRDETQSINLGMAVDVSAPGKPRQLVVPNIKDCASMNFATFLAAYDAQIREGAQGQADARRLQGHDLLADQPGHDRHDQLAAASDDRAVVHPGDRRDHVPGGLPGCGGGDDHRARCLEGHGADVDLRPPRDPGRRLR